MKTVLKRKIKLALMTAIVTGAFLTGCGTSSQQEQFSWLAKWDISYDAKMRMFDDCFEQAGVNSIGEMMSVEQNEMVNECEVSYITAAAENEGISLDRATIENNIVQL